MKLKKAGLVVAVLLLISMVLITMGTSYAFFSYVKEGNVENILTTGKIKFLYTENNGVGNGITLNNAIPEIDEVGKTGIGEGKTFDFTINGDSTGDEEVKYELTVEKYIADNKGINQVLPDDAIKIYLTEVAGTTEVECPLVMDGVRVKTFDELKETIMENGKGKTVYNGKIPGKTEGYSKAFRLRMWLSDDVDLTNDLYKDKEVVIKVNAYASTIGVVSEAE